MAKVPLPERGQPLDVAYIYQMANAINQTSDQIATTSKNYSSVYTASAGTQQVKNAELRFYADKVRLVTEESVTAQTVKTKTINFGTNNQFGYAPVVMATPVISAETVTDASQQTSVVVSSVTASSCDITLRFAKTGTATVDVYILAIGLPNIT